MSNHLPIILIRKLTRANLLVLPLLSWFGNDVRYMFYPEHMKITGATPENIEARLERKGLRKVDFGTIENLDQYGHLKHSPQHAKAVFEQIMVDVDFSALADLYPGVSDCAGKLPVLVYDQLINSAMEIGQMLSVAMAFSEQGRKVRVFCPADAVQSQILTPEVSGYENLLPRHLSSLVAVWHGLVFLFRAMSRVAQGVLQRRERGGACPATERDNEVSECGPRHQVVYYPHQGIFYGNLFLKDHFYEDDPNSPFHPSNILHVELHEKPPEESQRYYRENNIKHTVMRLGVRLDWANVVSICNALNLAWRATGGRKSLRTRVMATSLLVRGYLSFLRAWRNSAPLDGAKLVLVGFDYLFPTGLALALQARGMKVAAVQERFIHVFDNYFHPLLDIYFISGPYVRDQLLKNPFHWVREMPIIGLIRAGALGAFQPKLKKTAEKMVLVFDYHTNPNPLDDAFNPLFCWKSNKDFYQDILRLAATYPKVQFVIRGKDDAWCALPYFVDVMESINALPNISVNRQYDEMYVSYKLAASSDLIIARQTSLGDEALAAGIPVLFHDWTDMCTHNVSDVCDYDGFPVYTQSFEELAQRTDDVLSGRGYMDAREFELLRQNLFSAPVDNPKSKVMAHLHASLIACDRQG